MSSSESTIWSKRKRMSELHLAIQRNDSTRVEQLLSLGVDVNEKDGYSLATPLHTVAYWSDRYKNHIDMVNLLLKYGADVDAKNQCGSTPLHEVARLNKDEYLYEFAEVLLKNGADVNTRNNRGIVPLWSLVTKSTVKMVELFLNYEANVHVEENQGVLLYSALYNTRIPEVFQLLVDQGLDVNHRYADGKTILHLAHSLRDFRKLETLKLILRNGADMSAIDDDNNTPLAYLMQSYFSEGSFIKHSFEDLKKVKFVMEHANCSLMGDYNFMNHPGFIDLVNFRKIILSHLAKLEVLNVPVNPDYLRSISEQRVYNDYYNECKEELARARSFKFDNTWITCYHLLTGSRKALKNFAGNTYLIVGFNESECEIEFPIYGTEICENFKKAVKRRELFDVSCVLLSQCFPIFNPTHLIIRDVLDCILSKKYLSKFCK